ncbi:MAG: hypothetical protein ACOX3G_12760 [Armatimonadota bacterium]
MKPKNVLPIAMCLATFAAPALAQHEQQPTMVQVLTNTVTLAYILGSALVGYLIAVIFTSLTLRIGYPPNMARLGCWFGTCLWLIFIGFILFRYILHISMPVWFWASLMAFLVFFGVMLFLTRRHPARK